MSNINSVDINEKVYVSGIVDFSRIAAPLTAEELAADNARKSARGMRTVDKPYTHDHFACRCCLHEPQCTYCC